MTKEQKDKILKSIADSRDDYARDCVGRLAEEQGKIMGRLLAILVNKGIIEREEVSWILDPSKDQAESEDK